jgi:hypothetical protein
MIPNRSTVSSIRTTKTVGDPSCPNQIMPTKPGGRVQPGGTQKSTPNQIPCPQPQLAPHSKSKPTHHNPQTQQITRPCQKSPREFTRKPKHRDHDKHEQASSHRRTSTSPEQLQPNARRVAGGPGRAQPARQTYPGPVQACCDARSGESGGARPGVARAAGSGARRRRDRARARARRWWETRWSWRWWRGRGEEGDGI